MEARPSTPREQKDHLAAQRRRLDETVWANELLAQQYEQVLVHLWDTLLAEDRKGDQGDPFQVFQQLDFGRITLGQAQRERTLDLGITMTRSDRPGRTLTRSEWQQLVDGLRAEGYRIIQSEWHHAQFDPPTNQAEARSVVTFEIHATSHEGLRRWIVKGRLGVLWSDRTDARGLPIARDIQVLESDVLSQTGPVAFTEMLTIAPDSTDRRRVVHPIIVHDLDRNGWNDIVVAGCNRVYWNRGQGRFEQGVFLRYPEPIHEVGLMADFNGDGADDFLTVDYPLGNVLLYEGDAQGRFNAPPRGKGDQPTPLARPQVLSAGDIDQDGDLDVWIAQYLPPYSKGQMPTPYYDANDGLPAFLLWNDGKGNFPNVTAVADGAKQNRRTYGGSLVDLDDDGDLDLLVVSDFAGIDIYYNDGTGQFTDVTKQVVDQWHNFGMSVTFGDYNVDGKLDFYIAGMGSTTARRLDHLQLGRQDMPDVHHMRSVMGYGSRMYLADGQRFIEPAFRDQVNRTGWTWGTTTLDFDNDGDPDLYAANGHSSGKSTKDHCSHFWRHDIYTNSSEFNADQEALFRQVLRGYLDHTESWDGYQKNPLLMNLSGQGFINVAFLMGVAAQYDARAVVSDDLDNDGRVDLLVVEGDLQAGQKLHVYRNQLQTDNHWIGVRLDARTGGPSSAGAHALGAGLRPALGAGLLTSPTGAPSPLGAKVSVHTVAGTQVRRIVTGDSLSAQHAPVAHFGLGTVDRAEAIEIVWPDGQRQRLERPAIDQYHSTY